MARRQRIAPATKLRERVIIAATHNRGRSGACVAQ